MFVSGKRLISLIMAVSAAIFVTLPALSQGLITMEGDKCSNDIAAFATLTGSKVLTAFQPGRIMGRCTAQNVQITRADIELSVPYMEWKAGSFSGILMGDIPESMFFTAKGINIVKSPPNDPIWAFLKSQSHAQGGIKAALRFSYDPSEQTLDITQLALGFAGGHSIGVTAKVHGVSGVLAASPLQGVLSVVGDEVLVDINGRSGFMQDLFAALLMRSFAAKNPDETRSAAMQYVNSEFTYLLAQNDLSDLRKMVNSLPAPAGSISLGFYADNGVSAASVALMLLSDKPDWAKNGVSLSFGYDPAGFGGAN
ncbi:MAG: hypothetical protein V3U96_05455 [Paracoccaceae bacterium]